MKMNSRRMASGIAALLSPSASRFMCLGGLSLQAVAGAALALGVLSTTVSAQCTANIVSRIGGSPECSQARGTVQYVAYPGELVALDITNPAAPVELGSIFVSCDGKAMDLQGNYLYLCGEDRGLFIIDITNPAAMVQVARITGVDTIAAKATGNRLYVARDNDVSIYDITNPAAPALLNAGFVSAGISPEDISSVGTQLYVMDTVDEVHLYDVTNAAAPTLVSTYASFFSTINTDMSLRGNVLALATFDGVEFIDISVAGSMTRLSSVASNTIVDVVQMGGSAGSLAYFERESGIIGVYDLANLAAPVLVADVVANPQYMSSPNQNLFVTTFDGLVTFNMAVPAAPVQLSTWTTEPEGPRTVAISGTHAVTTSDSTLWMVNISNPNNPTVVGSVGLVGTGLTLDIDGNFAYVSILGSGSAYRLQKINISNPAAPVVVATGAVPEYLIDMDVVGDRVFGNGGNSDFYVLDISNPSAPVQLATLPDLGRDGIFVRNGYAYVGDFDNGVHTVDVRTPALPVVIDTLATRTNQYVSSFDVRNNLMLVGQSDNRVDIVDISDPVAPVLRDWFSVASSIIGVAILDSFAAVSTLDGRVSFADIADPTNAVLLDSTLIGSGLSTMDRRAGTMWGSSISGGLFGVHMPEYPRVSVRPQDLEACAGGTAAFSVTLANPAGATYQWRRNGVNLVNGAAGSATISGATTSTVTISNPGLAQLGNYDCVITNPCGAVTTGTARMTGNVTPVIGSQPSNAVICPQGSESLSILSTGLGNSYQWQREVPAGSGTYVNVVDASQPRYTIAGSTTRQLTISAVSGQTIPQAIAGNLRCVVTNGCGTATSSVAQVSISPCDCIDFNGDSLFPDTQDIVDFLAVFSGSACPTGTCNDIDFNNDGLFPDTQDIDSLISSFAGGAC
jgi:hypothetical protein